MTNDEKNILEAKKSIKSNIKLLNSILDHLKGHDKIMQARASWAAWCLHCYISDNLMIDIVKAMEGYGKDSGIH